MWILNVYQNTNVNLHLFVDVAKKVSVSVNCNFFNLILIKRYKCYLPTKLHSGPKRMN